MTATTTSGARSVLGRRPVLLPVAAAALAWVGLIAVHGWSSLRVPAGGIGPAGHSGHGDLLTVSGLVDVTLMTTAMMAPLAIGTARAVATGSRSYRAGRSIGWFFLAYLGTWTVIAGCLQPVAGLLDGVLGPSVAAGLLVALCALAQFDPHRADLTSSCERSMPTPGNGFQLGVDCLRFGARRRPRSALRATRRTSRCGRAARWRGRRRAARRT